MLIFIAKRFGFMIVTMLVVSMLLFLLLEINVDGVATKVLGPYSSQESREIWLQKNGYRDPLVLRYGRWLGNAAQGDFGDSYRIITTVTTTSDGVVITCEIEEARQYRAVMEWRQPPQRTEYVTGTTAPVQGPSYRSEWFDWSSDAWEVVRDLEGREPDSTGYVQTRFNQIGITCR